MNKKLSKIVFMMLVICLLLIMSFTSVFAESNEDTWYPPTREGGTSMNPTLESSDYKSFNSSTLDSVSHSSNGSGIWTNSTESNYPGYDITYNHLADVLDTSAFNNVYVDFKGIYKYDDGDGRGKYDARLYITGAKRYNTSCNPIFQIRYQESTGNIFLACLDKTATAERIASLRFSLRIYAAGHIGDSAYEINLKSFYFQVTDLDCSEAIGLPYTSGTKPTVYAKQKVIDNKLLSNLRKTTMSIYDSTGESTDGADFRVKFPDYNGIKGCFSWLARSTDSGMQLNILAPAGKSIIYTANTPSILKIQKEGKVQAVPSGMTLTEADAVPGTVTCIDGYFPLYSVFNGTRYYNGNAASQFSKYSNSKITANQTVKYYAGQRRTSSDVSVVNGKDLQVGDKSTFDVNVTNDTNRYDNTGTEFSNSSVTRTSFKIDFKVPECYDYSTIKVDEVKHCTTSVNTNTGVVTITTAHSSTAPYLLSKSNTDVNLNILNAKISATVKSSATGEYGSTPTSSVYGDYPLTSDQMPFVGSDGVKVNVVNPELATTQTVNNMSSDRVVEGETAHYIIKTANVGDASSVAKNVSLMETIPKGVNIDYTTFKVNGTKSAPASKTDTSFTVDFGNLTSVERVENGQTIEFDATITNPTSASLVNTATVTGADVSAATSKATVIPTYKIETAVENGTITPTTEDVAYGTDYTVYYAPNDGYQLDTIQVDDTIVDKSLYPNQYTFKNVEAHHYIKVIYKKAGLTITKTASGSKSYSGFYQKGDSVTYKLNGGIVGDATANNVVIKDRIPAGLDYTNGTSDKGTLSYNSSTREVSVSIPKLEYYEKVNAAITCQVSSDSTGEIENKATIEATGFDADSSTSVINIVKPNITINKTTDKTTYHKNDTISYNINFTNNQPNSYVDGVVITDDNMSKGLMVDKNSIFCSKDATITSISGGFKVAIKKMVKYNEPVTVSFKATIDNSLVESGMLSNTAQIITNQTAEQSATAEARLKYHITTSAHKGTIDESMEVDYGESTIISYEPFDENYIVHSIKVNGNEVDKDTYKDKYTFENIKDDQTIDVVYYTRPVIDVSKTVDKEKAQVGDTITYNVKTTTLQSGTIHEDLTNVVVTDNVPDSLEIINATTSDTGAKVVVNGQDITYTNPKISASTPAGEGDFTVVAKVKVDESIEGTTITNNATGKDDFSLEPSTSENVETYILKPQVELTKQFVESNYNINDTFEFNMTATNVGDTGSHADNFVITDYDMSNGGILDTVTSEQATITKTDKGFIAKVNSLTSENPITIHATGHFDKNKVASNTFTNTATTDYTNRFAVIKATANTNIQCNVATDMVNGSITDSQTVDWGANVSIDYVPNEKYRIEQVIVDGEQISVKEHPSSYSFDSIADNHDIKVVCALLPEMDLTITHDKSALDNDYFQPSDIITYHVIGKTSIVGAYEEDVVLTDTVAPNTTLVNATSNIGTVTKDGNIVTVKVDKLSYGQQIDLTITAQINNVDDCILSDVATLTGKHGSPKDATDDVYNVVPKIEMFKSSDKTKYNGDDTINYTVNVKNIKANSHEDNLVITDTDFSNGLVINPDTVKATKGTVEKVGSTFRVTIDRLLENEGSTITFDATLNKPAVTSDTVSNTASAKGKWCNEKSNTTEASLVYNITTDVVNGSITPSETDIPFGESRTIEYSNNEGYRLDKVLVDNTPVSVTDYANKYTFNNLADNHSIKVFYEKIPSLAITNKAERVYYQTGEEIIYHINIRNTTEGSYDSKVVMTDNVPQGLTVTYAKSTIGTTTFDGNQVVCKTDKLDYRDTQNITITAKVNGDTQVGAIENICSVCGQYSLSGASASSTIQIVKPALSIAKTTDREIYHKGDTINYQIEVADIIANTHDENITITDTDMSDGIEINESSIKSDKGTVEPQTKGFVVNGVSLEGNEKVTVTFDATVNNDTVKSSDLVNTASAKGKWSDEVENSKPIKYVYKIETAVENGTITPTVDNISRGETKTIEYAPKEGYILRELVIDGEKVNVKDYANSFTLCDIKDDHTIKAIYEPIPDLTITNNADKKIYTYGDTVDYTVKLRQGTSGATSSNVILNDAFAQTGYVKLNQDSIKIMFNNTDITDKCIISKADDGFSCITGKSVGTKDCITATFNGQAIKTINKLDNTAMGLCDENTLISKESPVATATISISSPKLFLSEKVKNSSSNIFVGDTVNFQVNGKVKNDSIAKDIVLSEKIDENLSLEKPSLKVFLNGCDITDSCKIATKPNSYKIVTNNNISAEDNINVSYNVKVNSANNSLTNNSTIVCSNAEYKADGIATANASINASEIKTIETPAEKNVSEKNNPPATGDNTSLNFIIIMLFFVLVALSILFLKYYQRKKALKEYSSKINKRI